MPHHNNLQVILHQIPSEKLKLIIGFPGGPVVKNPFANAGIPGNLGSIPRSGRSPGVGMETHSSILAWKILWLEEPDR